MKLKNSNARLAAGGIVNIQYTDVTQSFGKISEKLSGELEALCYTISKKYQGYGSKLLTIVNVDFSAEKYILINDHSHRSI